MNILSFLIRRKRESSEFATATPATIATQDAEGGRTVASVATVAAAESPQGQTVPPEKAAARGPTTASRWWLIHFSDRDPVELACSPDATHAEILQRYPYALAAEPFTPRIRQTGAPLNVQEERDIRAWLALIKETDPEIIAEVIQQCQSNTDARDYFKERAAAELPKPDPFPDDRRTCKQCENLSAGACDAAKNGELAVSKNYQPESTRPRRCETYRPGPDDPDLRHGAERWPGLLENEGE